MELAHSTVQQNYIKQVKVLEAKIEKATEGELDLDAVDDAQTRLDALAEKYQYNEKLAQRFINCTNFRLLYTILTVMTLKRWTL